MNSIFLRFAAPLSMVCLLAACAQAPPSAAGAAAASSSASAGTCSAAGAQFAVGRSADATLVEQARKRSGAQMARVLRPGQAVTMEFNAQRLNLDINAASLVTRARCG